jgi:hypothetical protein
VIVEENESRSAQRCGAFAEFRRAVQSLADDFRGLARNRSHEERERIFEWHCAAPYTQLYLAGGRRYVLEEAYPRMRRLSAWDEKRWSRHVQHIRDLAASVWMRNAALNLPFVLERLAMRPEFVEELEFQFLELLEKLEPPAVAAAAMIPAETLPALEADMFPPLAIPSEAPPSNMDQGPVSPDVSHEILPGSSPAPETSSPGSVEPDLPDLPTPAARRTFLDQFRAECKRLAEQKVTMSDLAAAAGHMTRNRRFAKYEWVRYGREGNFYRMLKAGPEKAAEFIKSPKNARIRATHRSAEAAPKV